jgi:hypothetical protein
MLGDGWRYGILLTPLFRSYRQPLSAALMRSARMPGRLFPFNPKALQTNPKRSPFIGVKSARPARRDRLLSP